MPQGIGYGAEGFLANPPVAAPLMQTLASLWEQGGTGGSMESLLSDLGRRIMEAQNESGRAQGALASERGKPVETIAPVRESVQRSLGNLVSGLRGDASGHQLAAERIRSENEQLLMKRKDNLAALEDAYQRAAARAEKMGDLEAEIKFKTSMQSAMDKRESISKLLLASAQMQAEQAMRQQLGEQEIAGRLSVVDREGALAQQLESIRQKGDERTAFINQGLDPDDPNKPLDNAKSQRFTRAKAMGFLDANQWTGALSRITSQVYSIKTKNHDVKSLRSRVLNELPPEASYFQNPDGWFVEMMNLRNPDNPQKPLFERDRNGVLTPKSQKELVNYMQRYWPEFMAPVVPGRK